MKSVLEVILSKPYFTILGTTDQQFTSLPVCTLMTEQEKRASFTQNKYTESAIVAVYSYANALRRAHQTLCGGSVGLCSNLVNLSPQQFYTDYLHTTDLTFTNTERIPSLASSTVPPYNTPKTVKFNQHGDIMGVAFDIYNYQYQNTVGFDFVKVTTFSKSAN